MSGLAPVIFLALISTCLAEFSSTGAHAIMDVHNKLRSDIALGNFVAKGSKKAPATNMLKMAWSLKLAAQAQNYTNTCPHMASGTAGVGENIIFLAANNDTDLDQYGVLASQAWQQEFQAKGWPTNYFDKNLFNLGIGHATQMAWAASSEIGCGVTQCLNGGFQIVTVCCQYKPPGNNFNQYIYNAGSTCLQCPSGTSCEPSTGLCA